MQFFLHCIQLQSTCRIRTQAIGITIFLKHTRLIPELRTYVHTQLLYIDSQTTVISESLLLFFLWVTPLPALLLLFFKLLKSQIPIWQNRVHQLLTTQVRSFEVVRNARVLVDISSYIYLLSQLVLVTIVSSWPIVTHISLEFTWFAIQSQI